MIQKAITRALYAFSAVILCLTGVVGLLPSHAQAAAPYPSAANAGLTSSSGLTPFSGHYDISANNTVLENMDITGYLTVQGTNITIRNVRIDTGGDTNIFYALRVYSGSVTIENVEIIGGESAAITGTGFSLRNSYIHNFNGDGIVPATSADGITIQDNYIYDPDGFGTPFHRDGIQIQSGITNTVIKHNNIDIGVTGSLTAAIFVANDRGPDGAGPLLIEDNLLSGGSYSLGAFKTGDLGTISGITIRYNRLTESHVNQYCSLTDTSADVQWYANVKDIDGSLIPGCNNMTSPDVTVPSVSVTTPVNGATVSGTTAIAATAADNSGLINKVEFYIDGSLLSTDTTSAYTASWNTTAVSNGSHAITAKAYDPSGNSATSSTITVTVNNAVQPPSDADNDGISSSEEDGGSNGGDGNGDGVQDSQQAGVAGYKNTKQDAYNTLEASGSCATLKSVVFSSTSTADLPKGETNTFGQLGFSVQCPGAGQSSNIKLFLDRVYTTSQLRVHKVGAKAADITSSVVFGVATIGGQKVTTVSYTLVDGGPLDEDGLANGMIVDPLVITTVDVGLANTGQPFKIALALGIGTVIAGAAGLMYIRKRYFATGY